MISILKYLQLAAILLVFFSPRLGAEEINVPIDNFALLSNENDGIRILTRFEIPENISDSTLVFAELRFGIIPQLVEDSILRIDCFAVTTNWDRQDANWDHPWDNPGGDFEESELTMFTTSAVNADRAYFDLTEIVRSWLGNERENHGLIFIIPYRIPSRFDIRDLPDNPENAVVEVRFITK